MTEPEPVGGSVALYVVLAALAVLGIVAFLVTR